MAVWNRDGSRNRGWDGSLSRGRLKERNWDGR